MSEQPITMYKSDTCPHSRMVENLVKKYNIPVAMHNISTSTTAREAVMALNNGNASVPTLIFPDGTQMTEPSMNVLRERLGIKMGLFDRFKLLFGL